MLVKEYRICMPLTVEEYRIGQLYMIAKHSLEQSEKGEGVEVVRNEPCEHAVHGKGQFTEKRIYLSSRLPSYIQVLIPNIFYITEKAWNYYPYTITEYTCSFIPKYQIHIETRYEDNSGTTENCLGLSEEDLKLREVVHQDIAFDEVPEKHYKEQEDLTKFKSKKTGRGPLQPGWRANTKPVMCSYKLARVKFEVWGLQTKIEGYTHKIVKDILLLGHRQAFAWIDEWHGMTIEDIREYERRMQQETNRKVKGSSKSSSSRLEVKEPVRRVSSNPASTSTDQNTNAHDSRTFRRAASVTPIVSSHELDDGEPSSMLSNDDQSTREDDSTLTFSFG